MHSMTGFQPMGPSAHLIVHGAFAFELQFGEFRLVRLDDLADLVTCWTRIKLDVIVKHRELSQPCLGDPTIHWDDYFAGVRRVIREKRLCAPFDNKPAMSSSDK